MRNDFVVGPATPNVSAGYPYVARTGAGEAKTESPQTRGRSRVWATLSLALVLLLAPVAALGWYQYEYAGRVFRGVSALGLDLSGLTADEAAALLAARAGEMTARPVLIEAGDHQWRTDWGRLGLVLPTDPIVARAMAVGREGGPLARVRAQLEALRDGVSISASETFDERPLRSFVASAVVQVDRPMRNARLDMLPDLSFAFTSAQEGRRLDPDMVLGRLQMAADRGESLVKLETEVVRPRTTDDMRLPAKWKAERILGGDLTLEYRDRRWQIGRGELAELLVFSGGPGIPISVRVETEKLLPRLESIATELAQEPRDGRVDWNGGNPRPLVPSLEGRRLDARIALQAIEGQVESDDRTVRLPVEVRRPTIDTDDIGRMGLRELLAGSSTSIATALPQKRHNVRLAASRLNGLVIPPRAPFSFNKALGPTTLDNGYQVAFGITSDASGPRTVPSVAGGICQVATTLFQPVFWSGYQIEERHWHLYWIPGYASRGLNGLDATVDEEAGLDLRFTNNTDGYILIQARADGANLSFELYGTRPPWEVKVEGPQILNRKPPDPAQIFEYEPSLAEGHRVVVEAAGEGFTAVFVRTVSESGGPRTLRLESRYAPSRNVTLIGTGGKPPPRGADRPTSVAPPEPQAD
jgi:vancomycin resistance protein YoaR